ncbi:Fc.00g003630.m01.CDS01 [Cosmosporella sp. VM-42]
MVESSLTDGQLDAIGVIERVCSVFSLLGSIFVIITFILSKAFHKPINRLVFYASFGNMLCNVGTLMSRTYLLSPDSVGCQFQAFLMQMFLPADAFWTLAMAINVYLTFYFKFDARRLRRMEIPYLLGCYGVPFVPAFVYIFVRNTKHARVYGDATLWCWVAPEWDVLRIATFYGPIWVVIVLTFFIYIRAGHTIYLKRKQLNNFSSTNEDPLSTVANDILTTIKTTEVSVTTEARGQQDSIHLQPIGRRGPDINTSDNGNAAYSVTISADTHSADIGDVVLPIQGQPGHQSTYRTPVQRERPPNPRRRNHELNNAAWSYTKCALLFFTAILITWIPSSANRVYSVIHGKHSSAPLEFMSAFVLPLQGFWNALIYAVTSWNACKNLANDLKFGRRPDVTELVGGMALDIHHHHHHHHNHRHDLQKFKTTARSKATYETESMTELANSRPNSDDERERHPEIV